MWQAEPTPDERVSCLTCTKRCKVPVLVRCDGYVPTHQQIDQRNGKERWPQIAIERKERDEAAQKKSDKGA